MYSYQAIYFDLEAAIFRQFKIAQKCQFVFNYMAWFCGNEIQNLKRYINMSLLLKIKQTEISTTFFLEYKNRGRAHGLVGPNVYAIWGTL
jgi:hypothetical protein